MIGADRRVIAVVISEEELAQFVEALRKRDTKSARAWLESKRSEGSTLGEFEEGFFLALNGMIASIENAQSPSLMKRVLEVEMPEVQKLLTEFEKRSAQKFRPQFERGFDTAWVMVLQRLLQS